MSPGLGLADPPFGTMEPGLRRFPRAGLSAPALGRGPGRHRARAVARCVLGPRDGELTLGGCKVRPWPRAPGGCKGRPWLRAARSGEVFCTGGSSPGKISARRSPRVRSAVRYDDVDGSRLLSHACGQDRSQSCRSSLVLAHASPCSDRALSRAPSPIACASSARHFWIRSLTGPDRVLAWLPGTELGQGQFKQGRKHEQGATEDCRVVRATFQPMVKGMYLTGFRVGACAVCQLGSNFSARIQHSIVALTPSPTHSF